jgi:dodecin
MSVARVTEITSASSKSLTTPFAWIWLAQTERSRNVTGAWIKDQEGVAQDGKISEYRVRMKITVVLKA